MNKIFAVALLALAVAGEDQRVLTINGEREIFELNGRRVHPLLQYQRADVIVYPDIGAFSTRMTPFTKTDSSAVTALERAIADTF